MLDIIVLQEEAVYRLLAKREEVGSQGIPQDL